jgi:hypothetical protein
MGYLARTGMLSTILPPFVPAEPVLVDASTHGRPVERSSS